MTPNTQSVCKHCQQPKGDLVHSRWAAPELHHKFEPVAEPASTGEPEPEPQGVAEVARQIAMEIYAGFHHASSFQQTEAKLVDILRPLLPPASTALCPKCGGFVYKCEKFGHITPDSHLGAVRD